MKFSLYDFLVEYKEHKPEIDAYLHGQPIENYSDDNKIMGLEIGLFIVLLLIGIFIWIWSIVVLVKYWKILPDWAKVIGVLGVIPAVPIGPIVTLIVVYITKQGQ